MTSHSEEFGPSDFTNNVERFTCALYSTLAERGGQHAFSHRVAEVCSALWSVLLETKISPSQFYQCMAIMKVARLAHGFSFEDSCLDLAGYAFLIGEIAHAERRRDWGAGADAERLAAEVPIGPAE